MTTDAVSQRQIHLSAGIIWKFEHGQVRFLVIQYVTNDSILWKFPGGTNKESAFENESDHDTLRRGLTKELARPGHMFHLDWRNRIFETPVYIGGVPEHKQYFFLIGAADWRVSLRTEAMADGEVLLHPPQWLKAKELLPRVFKGHRDALMAAIHSLSASDPALNYSLSSLV